MNSIKLGWIDYSSEHRSKVMAVLQALSTPGAVDELGVGQIRDGFANRLFPGTSTIQTRAKYFFIVPYILLELEKQKHLSQKAILDKLEAKELDLIEPLKKSGESGVIGENAGRRLKRRPSSIYWNGLRTFEFSRYPQLTLDDYARAVSTLNKDVANQMSMGKRTDDEQSDDPDAYQGRITGGFWRCLPPPNNWEENISIHLLPEEAAYLKERILKSSHSKESMLAFLLKQNPAEVEEVNDFDALGEKFALPDSLSELYEKAVMFSNFIYGATLRYNVILSEGKNQKVVTLWDEWRHSFFVEHHFAAYDPNEAMDFLRINNYRLRLFLQKWYAAFLAGDELKMDELIVRREIELKSRERAKLQNPAVYVYREGHGVRGGKLDYRLGNSKVILKDIFEGMEGSHA